MVIPELNYFGARYLDLMLGLWVSVDPARQYDSPYTYAGNNPIIVTDPDGNVGVVGAGLGIAVGYAQAYAVSQVTGKPVDYTIADIICDAAFGATGLTALKQGSKAYAAAKTLNEIKTTKSLTRHKWMNRYDDAKKTTEEAVVGMGLATGGKAVAKAIANPIENQIVDEDPGLMENLVDGISNWVNERLENDLNTDFSDSHDD